MSLQQMFQQYLPMIASAVGGMLLTWIVQQFQKKRGTFSYYVNHNRMAQSTEDAVFGAVGVTWNGNSVPNLYLSTVELVNESMNDYENVAVRAYTNDTNLFTEQTQIVGTSHILEWSEKYKGQLHVDGGNNATDSQRQIFSSQREYIIPAMNRGQVVRLNYLNSAKGNSQPNIWLDVVHKGVRLKFRRPQNQLLGVSQPLAALVGSTLGFFFIGVLIYTTTEVWIAALASLVYGLVAQVPGAYIIKTWRKCREFIGG
jgi:ABC-type antimicrobial peptide transport system permease subunit